MLARLLLAAGRHMGANYESNLDNELLHNRVELYAGVAEWPADQGQVVGGAVRKLIESTSLIKIPIHPYFFPLSRQ